MSTGRHPYALLRGGGVVAGLLFTAFVLFVGALVNFFLGGPGRLALLVISVVLPLSVVRLAISVMRDRIDSRIERELGGSLRGLSVAAHDFPDYRFVDAFRAVEGVLGEQTVTVDSAHLEDLGSILNGTFYGSSGFPAEPGRVARAVDPSHDEYFPMERFWIRSGPHGLVARLRHLEHASSARLEVAAREAAEAERTVSAIRELSVANSIYRGRMLEVSFAPGVKDALGNIDQAGKVKVDFRRTPAISEQDIVLDSLVWPLIQHSLIDLHRNRAALRACNVAVKRGLLFYGPPGTGKSFTCRYIATMLPGTTMVYSTGAALHDVSSTFNLARMLQPAVIVMEDVDLVFASRDINASGGELGDLFDQIDLLRDDEPISVILTTNAIDRLEAAVKDRPGRVSQCLYFGPPSPDLRRRYLVSCLRHHEIAELDVERVVRETDGATQAFLKELVHRALQFCVEAGRSRGARATPTTADFAAALAEIRAFDAKTTRVITGFRVGLEGANTQAANDREPRAGSVEGAI